MQCEEALLMIDPFMKDELRDRELEEFLEHLKTCPRCYDELEIYYTIKMSVKYLETENLETYDIPRMLKEELRQKERYLHHRKALLGSVLGLAMLLMVCGLIAALLYLGHIELPKLV